MITKAFHGTVSALNDGGIKLLFTKDSAAKGDILFRQINATDLTKVNSESITISTNFIL